MGLDSRGRQSGLHGYPTPQSPNADVSVMVQTTTQGVGGARRIEAKAPKHRRRCITAVSALEAPPMVTRVRLSRLPCLSPLSRRSRLSDRSRPRSAFTAVTHRNHVAEQQDSSVGVQLQQLGFTVVIVIPTVRRVLKPTYN